MSMEINIELLGKCPVLSDYQKDLIKRIGVDQETQASVAEFYGKAKSTISVQHRKALAKFSDWIEERRKHGNVQDEEDFDKRVFKLFNTGVFPNRVVEELGNVKRVTELWKKYREFVEDDYLMAVEKTSKYGFKPNRSSRTPLADQVQRIINERYWLADEKESTWKLINELKYGVYTIGINKNDYGSTPKAVRRVLDHVGRKIQLLEERRSL